MSVLFSARAIQNTNTLATISLPPNGFLIFFLPAPFLQFPTPRFHIQSTEAFGRGALGGEDGVGQLKTERGGREGHVSEYTFSPFTAAPAKFFHGRRVATSQAHWCAGGRSRWQACSWLRPHRTSSCPRGLLRTPDRSVSSATRRSCS